MRPFLSLYAALTVENERQTLRAIVEQKKEYLRLKTAIEERERALERFVAEHLPPSEEEMLPTAEELRERIALCQAELERLEQEQNRLRPEIGRLEEDADAVAELEARAAAEERQLAEYRANAATIQTAEKLLGEAKEALSTRYMAGMQRSFLEALSYFPPQIMPEAVLSTSFDVLTREGGETHPEESLSRGLRDAVQFCVRLALAKELFAEGEQPFLLLDDPFVNLDDDRMEAVKEMLERLGADYQVLHLVCSTARL